MIHVRYICMMHMTHMTHMIRYICMIHMYYTYICSYFGSSLFATTTRAPSSNSARARIRPQFSYGAVSGLEQLRRRPRGGDTACNRATRVDRSAYCRPYASTTSLVNDACERLVAFSCRSRQSSSARQSECDKCIGDCDSSPCRST